MRPGRLTQAQQRKEKDLAALCVFVPWEQAQNVSLSVLSLSQ